MVVTKLSQNEWASLVEKQLAKYSHKRVMKRQLDVYERFWNYIYEHRLIPIIIGIGACLAVVMLWDWHMLINMLLSWVIGIVVVTTMVAGILHPGHPNRFRR